MATISKKPPLRVPRGNPGPIPAAIPLDEAPAPSKAPQRPLTSDPFEDDDDESPASPVDTATDQLDDPELVSPSSYNVASRLNEAQKAKITARKLPPLPPRVKFEEFIDYWKQLSTEQKDHIVIYWYRLKPVIDRKITNPSNANYIDVSASDDQMSLEYMINNHGGGKYHGRINDTDLRKQGQICEIFLEINQAQHEPIVDLEELDITHRENQAFVNKLKAQGRLTADGRIVKNLAAEAKREENMNANVTNKLLDALLAKPAAPANDGSLNIAAITGVIDMMKQQMVNDSPQTQLNMLMTLVEKMTPKAPAVSESDMMLKFFTMMEAQRQVSEAKIAELHKQILELMSAKNEKPDITSEIEKVKALAEAIGMGGGGGKSSIVDKLIETVGPAIPGIVNIISSRLNTGATQQTNPGIPRMPNELETNPGAMVPMPPDGGNDVALLDIVISQKGNDLITAIANGVPGDEAAESVVNLAGLPTYNAMIKDGPEAILAAMQRNAQFWQAISRITTTERLTIWINQFVEFGSEESEPAVDEPVKPIKKGKAN